MPSYDGVRAYIVDRRRKPHLLHIGSPGLRVDHIKAGASLRRVLDRELDDVVKRGRSTDRPLDLMRALRASLNVPPSTRDHWFLREPTLTQTEQRRFAWFADQQSHLASQLWHWGKLIALGASAVRACGGAAHGSGTTAGHVRWRSRWLRWSSRSGLFWRWLTRGQPMPGADGEASSRSQQNQGARGSGPSGSEQDGQPRHPQIGMDDVDRDESRPLVFQPALPNVVYRSHTRAAGGPAHHPFRTLDGSRPRDGRPHEAEGLDVSQQLRRQLGNLPRRLHCHCLHTESSRSGPEAWASPGRSTGRASSRGRARACRSGTPGTAPIPR